MNTKQQEIFEKICKMLQEKGATPISKEYKNSATPFYFKCAKCGKQHHLLWCHTKRGSNPDFLCKECNEKAKKPTIEQIREIFSAKGAKLITSEYINGYQSLEFTCSVCGKIHKISWTHFQQGSNPNLICSDCMNYKLSEDKIAGTLKSKGAEFLRKENISNNTVVYFKCSICGEEGKIYTSHFYKGVNPNFLCSKCLRGNTLSPNMVWARNRHNVDNIWFKFIWEFFNVPYGMYAAHHVIPFKRDKNYALSLVNGYPLNKKLHCASYNDGIQNPFHVRREFLLPQNWPQEAKLPYHNYPNFKFLDLNSKMITTIIYQDESVTSGTLLKQKEEWAGKGILFIPLYFEEMFIKEKAQIVYSMIRARLWKWFPDIYKYTGQEFNRYQARKLQLRELTKKEEQDFFKQNHIQGFVGSKVAVGLLDGMTVVAAMSFGTPRIKDHYEWELLRYACQKNSFVAGGAQRLFKYFTRNYNPENIISYCDIRFSFLNPEDTIYPKLGFVYDGKTAPNYKYYHPDYNRLFSRQQFQKHKLKEKLENFDPKKSEAENMADNGYIRQYDCGNFRFIWKKQ